MTIVGSSRRAHGAWIRGNPIMERRRRGGEDCCRVARPIAFQLATPLIDQGDASTQWFLGHLCHNGLYGMEVDLKSAGEWYRKAAAQGYARAVEALGGLRSGRAGEAIRLGAVSGANQKVIEVPARTWLNLGEDDCEVITPCSREHCKVAFRWYVAAGKRGDVEAQIALGRLYEDGIYVRQSRARAIKWYEKAAPESMEAQLLLDRATAEEQADYWRRAYAKERAARREYILEKIRRRLGPPPTDPIEAFEWYRKLAEDGDPDAQWELSIAYARGLGVRHNFGLTLKWLNLACDNHPDPDVREFMKESLSVMDTQPMVGNMDVIVDEE